MVPNKIKNYIYYYHILLLLLLYIMFYASEVLLYLPMLIISIFTNYLFGLKIDKYKDNNKNQQRIVILSIIFKMLFLGIFKY